MKNKLMKVCAAFLITGLMAVEANAASIWLVPDQADYAVGDTVSVTVMVDASDEPILAGGFDTFIAGLGTVLGYTGFTFDAAFPTDPSFTSTPTDCSVDTTAIGCAGADELNSLAFGNFAGIGGPFTVGVMTFDALAMGVASLTMMDNDIPSGSFFSTAGNLMTIDYVGTEIRVVPLPAAVWLMLGGLGMLLGFGKKRRDLKMAAA